jgi:hypothetical protein
VVPEGDQQVDGPRTTCSYIACCVVSVRNGVKKKLKERISVQGTLLVLLVSNIRISLPRSGQGSVSRSLCVHRLMVLITSDNGQMYVSRRVCSAGQSQGLPRALATRLVSYRLCSRQSGHISTCYVQGVTHISTCYVQGVTQKCVVKCYQLYCKSKEYVPDITQGCWRNRFQGACLFQARRLWRATLQCCKTCRIDSERMRREKKLSYNVTGNVEFQLSGKVCNGEKL